MKSFIKSKNYIVYNNKSKDINLYIEEFRHVRANYRRALIDDYLELISDLNIKFREVRQIDIAMYLGVSQPTVAKMIKKLVYSGLVKHLSYRGIILTNHGRKLAKESKQRHNIVKQFLIALGSNPKIAGLDAEGIEHHISEETLKIFKKFYQKEKIFKN